MEESIAKTLDELEIQSTLERSKKFNILPEDRMLAITKETGELLNMILRLKNAKNTLEIGMSTGYSTIWCAEAIYEQSGKIITIEQNPNKIRKSRRKFSKGRNYRHDHNKRRACNEHIDSTKPRKKIQ